MSCLFVLLFTVQKRITKQTTKQTQMTKLRYLSVVFVFCCCLFFNCCRIIDESSWG